MYTNLLMEKNINIQNILYGEYKCNKGHFLNWTGSNKLSVKSKCKKCEKLEVNNSIRWECLKCEEFFCQFCFPLEKFLKCPIYHEYEIKKFQYSNFNQYHIICDLCLESSIQNKDIFFDPECNITFCNKCVNNYEDFITQFRED